MQSSPGVGILIWLLSTGVIRLILVNMCSGHVAFIACSTSDILYTMIFIISLAQLTEISVDQIELIECLTLSHL